MAHWAEIKNGIVVRVLVGDNNSPDEGYTWLINNLGGTWVKTSYNAEQGIDISQSPTTEKNKARNRKNYAGVGYTYDPTLDIFYPPKPFASWSLNVNTGKWKSPKPYPTDGKEYTWDEESLAWKELSR